ncbi:hypothetical protein DWW15_09585 [Subdoligranulum sp. AF14-43]|nr:hypothetical protein DWW15_09585 [Subdoligranulum sp. AF14-43]
MPRRQNGARRPAGWRFGFPRARRRPKRHAFGKSRTARRPPPGRAPLLCANAPLRLVRGRKMGYNKSAYDARLSSARFLVKEKSYEIL